MFPTRRPLEIGAQPAPVIVTTIEVTVQIVTYARGGTIIGVNIYVRKGIDIEKKSDYNQSGTVTDLTICCIRCLCFLIMARCQTISISFAGGGCLHFVIPLNKTATLN